MSLIYEPTGRAREYSPLALNIYNGCAHGCIYCYVPAIMRREREEFKRDVMPRKTFNLEKLERDADRMHGDPRQVLLSFTSDPYQPAEQEYRFTRESLRILLAHEMKVAILTKSEAVIEDMGLIAQFGKHVKVGTTLTTVSDVLSGNWEPHAAAPGVRVGMLEMFHREGIPTWISMEPVMDAIESLNALRAALPFVGEVRLGKLNHDPERGAMIDWDSYLANALSILRGQGKLVVVKEDLRGAAPRVTPDGIADSADATVALDW